MSTVDYVIDALLVLVIVRQVRAHELTSRSLLLPLVLLAVAAAIYVRPASVHGGGLALVAALIVLGALLGTISGAGDRMWSDPAGRLFARAGAVSVVAWVVGMGSRFAFVYYAYHGGARSVASFSARHHIGGAAVWTLALFLMAVGQVLARLATLHLRRVRYSQPTAVPASSGIRVDR